jgi:hypothetical protein
MPKCTGEMKIIRFICERTVIKKILSHLNIFEEKKKRRALPMPEVGYTERVKIVPDSDRWPEHDEVVFEF